MGAHSAEETKDAVAKVGFAAVLAAVMGPVGILVAALAVGVEQAWNGDAGRTTSEDLTRDRIEAERQWLAEDRAWRHAQRVARQKWLDGGADPTTEPARPSNAESAGRFWRRVYARMVVASDDFARGFRDGWQAAKDARQGGADWRDTARTRPDKPEPDDPDLSGSDEPIPDTAPPEWETEPPLPWPPVKPQVTPPPTEPDDPQVRLDKHNDQPTGSDPEPQEDSMTSPNGTAPQGESNASVLKRKLLAIGATLTRVEAGVDDLGRLADSLAAQVREAYDFATSTGQIAATKQALDAANAVVAKLRALVIAASEAAVSAVEQVGAVRASLTTAERAEDALRSAGGTGDAVATAKAA